MKTMRLKVLFIMALLAILSMLMFARGSEYWTNYPAATYPSIVADDWTLLFGSKSHATNVQMTMPLMLQITRTNAQVGMQPGSQNLTNWSNLATSAKQDHSSDLDLWSNIDPATKQDHSLNLDSWSALATSSKEDQSANLDLWSAIAPSAKQDHSVNLDGWSALATSSKQAHSAGLDFWSSVTGIDSGTLQVNAGLLTVIGGGGGGVSLNQVSNVVTGMTIGLDNLSFPAVYTIFGVGPNTNPVPMHLGTGLHFDPATSNLNVTVTGGGANALAITNILVTNNIPLVMDLAQVQSGTLQLLTNASLVFSNAAALTNYHDQQAMFNVWQDTNGTRRLTSVTVAGGILRTNNNNWQGTNASEMDTLIVKYGPTGTNLLARWETNWLPTLSYTNTLNAGGGGGGGGGGAWTLIASVSVSGDGSTSTLTSSPIDTTGANLIVCFIQAAGFATLSDNGAGGTPNSYTDLTDPSGSPRAGFKYKISPSVGPGHTFTAINGISFIVQAWKKNAGTPVLDVDAAGASGGGSGWDNGGNVQPGSITPTTSADLMLSGIIWDVGTDPSLATINSTYTIGTAIHTLGSGSGPVNLSLATKIKSDAAAENPTWHNGGYATPNYALTHTSFK